MQVFIEEVQAGARALIYIEKIVRETRINQGHQYLLDQSKVKFQEHQLQMIPEEGLDN